MGAKILLSDQKIILHEARRDLLANVSDDELRKFRVSLYHVLPRILFGTPTP